MPPQLEEDREDESDLANVDPSTLSSVSFEKVMAQSFCDLDVDTLQSMKDAAPGLVTSFRLKGMVTDAEMDILKIPRMIGDEGKQYSEEVYWKGLARLITADETVLKYRNYAQEQAFLADPVNIAARKALATAMKGLAKNEKLMEKRLAKEAKAAATAAEKERKSLLTPAQRKMELEQKKQAKEEKRLQDLARDLAVVASQGYVTVDEEEFDEEFDEEIKSSESETDSVE